MSVSPYLIGLGVLVALWVLYGFATGKWNPLKAVEGADGRASTSKFQWFIWTLVIVFSYVAIISTRFSKGEFDPIAEIPRNVLTALGLSTTTMVASKAITVTYINSGRLVKTKANDTHRSSSEGKGFGAIFMDDDGYPDLSKIQMVAWTLIAVGVYLARVGNELTMSAPGLPDIDDALMVLTGLGEGAYLGKKLVTTTRPRLTGLSAGSGKPGTEVTIMGLGFGDSQGGSLITIDGYPFQGAVSEWKDTQIKFAIPAEQPTGVKWPKEGLRVALSIIVGGQDGANTLPFTITPD